MSEILDAILAECASIDAFYCEHIATMKDGTKGRIVGSRIHGTYWDFETNQEVPSNSYVLLEGDPMDGWRPTDQIASLDKAVTE